MGNVLTVEQLLLEGARLVRPSQLLVEGEPGSSPSGVWGGSGIVHPPAENWTHWVTVDCSWLQENGYDIRGCLSIYRVMPEGDDGDAVQPEWVALLNPDTVIPDDVADGVLLIDKEAPSFPPLEAVCLYGSTAVGDWLHSLGVSRQDCGDAAVYRSGMGDAYILEYMKHSPIYVAEEDAPPVDVVMGGWWHSVYLQSDYEHNGDSFLLATLRDAEPWVEVWMDAGGGLHVEVITSHSRAARPNRHGGHFVLRYG